MAIDKLSANAFATGAIANSLGYTPANKAGDTFTGNTVITGKLDIGGSASPLLRVIENTQAGNPKIQLLDYSNADTTITEGMEMWYESSTGHSYLSSIYSTGNLILRTANTARVTVAANGFVGLGTNTPVFKLNIGGSGGALLGSGGSGIYVSPSNDNTINSYYDGDTDDSNFWINYRGYRDGFTRFRQTHIADGKGNAVVTVTGSTRVVSLPYGQLKFPASQNASTDANTLDDYEEGTWTPTDASGAGLSFSSVKATYVKIGKMVTVSFILAYPATSSGASAIIGGLPFTASPGDNNNWIGGINHWNNKSLNLTHLILGNTTQFTFRNNGNNTDPTNATLTSGNYRGTITYEAS